MREGDVAEGEGYVADYEGDLEKGERYIANEEEKMLQRKNEM